MIQLATCMPILMKSSRHHRKSFRGNIFSIDILAGKATATYEKVAWAPQEVSPTEILRTGNDAAELVDKFTA